MEITFGYSRKCLYFAKVLEAWSAVASSVHVAVQASAMVLRACNASNTLCLQMTLDRKNNQDLCWAVHKSCALTVDSASLASQFQAVLKQKDLVAISSDGANLCLRSGKVVCEVTKVMHNTTVYHLKESKFASACHNKTARLRLSCVDWNKLLISQVIMSSPWTHALCLKANQSEWLWTLRNQAGAECEWCVSLAGGSGAASLAGGSHTVSSPCTEVKARYVVNVLMPMLGVWQDDISLLLGEVGLLMEWQAHGIVQTAFSPNCDNDVLLDFI